MRRIKYMLFMILFAPVYPATLRVPNDQPTIQAAVDAASSGDTILIASGLFSGDGNRDIDFHGKELAIFGHGSGLTVIDCGGDSLDPHIGFDFHSAEDSSSLTGLSIVNAYGNKPYGEYGNGAITCTNGSPVLTKCTFRSNHTNGVFVNGNSAPFLINLTISSNDGWGVFMPGYPYLSLGVRIEGCLVDHNVMGGIVLQRVMAWTSISRNTIAENGGDGLRLSGDMPRAAGFATWDTTAIIEQNIIAFNSGAGMQRVGYFTGLHFYRNDVYGNTDGDWKYVLYDGVDTVCNISADPLFCAQGGLSNYRLTFESPCLAENNICAVNMGASGAGCDECCAGTRGNVDGDANDVVDITDVTAMTDFLFEGRPLSDCAAENDTNGDSTVDISDLVSLVDFLFFEIPLSTCP
jgi:hypothetical protein